MIDLNQALNNVKKWVAEVGRIQLEKLEEERDILTKSQSIDLVTDVDKLSEEILIRHITETYPAHAILGEESGNVTREGAETEYQWIIDPLDGTTNYAHRFPLFAISVALAHKGDIVLGVVYLPKINECFTAVIGEGAFLNGKQIHVSETKRLEESLLGTGFPYDRAVDENNNLSYFNHLKRKARGIRRTGSAAFDLCNVAARRFDGYWELKLKLWDMAAGMLIVKEAGGLVTTVRKEKGYSTIAGNPAVHTLLTEELEQLSLADTYGNFKGDTDQ